MRALAIIALVAAGCGGGKGKGKPRPPAPKPAADADKPEPPPPSCSVAINEFLWAVEVHDSARVRDELVGECIDGVWTAAQRRCVAAAADANGLRACSIKSAVTIVLGSSSPGAELGIAECDELLERYRRCILPKKDTGVAEDTKEALVETVAIWREGLSRPGGASTLQARCQRISRSLSSLFASEGCEDKK